MRVRDKSRITSKQTLILSGGDEGLWTVIPLIGDVDAIFEWRIVTRQLQFNCDGAM